jgi:hypothetical protein
MSITMTTEEDGGIDQFVTCITIASACNLVFRTNFLRPATIGIIPAQGYVLRKNIRLKPYNGINTYHSVKGYIFNIHGTVERK